MYTVLHGALVEILRVTYTNNLPIHELVCVFLELDIVVDSNQSRRQDSLQKESKFYVKDSHRSRSAFQLQFEVLFRQSTGILMLIYKIVPDTLANICILWMLEWSDF